MSISYLLIPVKMAKGPLQMLLLKILRWESIMRAPSRWVLEVPGKGRRVQLKQSHEPSDAGDLQTGERPCLLVLDF